MDNGNKEIHVTFLQDKNQWVIKMEGNPDPLATFTTKAEAMDAGREMAKQHRTELVIHDQNGTIREKNSYGNDPRQSAG